MRKNTASWREGLDWAIKKICRGRQIMAMSNMIVDVGNICDAVSTYSFIFWVTWWDVCPMEPPMCREAKDGYIAMARRQRQFEARRKRMLGGLYSHIYSILVTSLSSSACLHRSLCVAVDLKKSYDVCSQDTVILSLKTLNSALFPVIQILSCQFLRSS